MTIKSMDAPQNIRAIASHVVHEVAVNSQSLSTALPNAIESLSPQIAPQDKALLQEMVFGVCRWFFSLEQLHNSLLNRPVDRNNKLAESLLKVGAYQLVYMRIPSHAAINETVSAAEALGLGHLKGMINAILRKINQLDPLQAQQAYESSHPPWMQAKIRNNWPTQSTQVFQQNNQHPPMTLRVNSQSSTRENYLAELSAAGIEARACSFASQGITLAKPCAVTQLPHFEAGAVSVQDEAAQLCCNLLDLKPNLRVLDACSAPGGKTCAMLEQEPSLIMTSLDSDHQRTERTEENLARLDLKTTLKVAPAENLEAWWDNQPFDRILLDAPCSATGVIRRHPDIKLLRKEGDIKQLAEVQLNLLQTLWKTLATGGTLIYATCSIFPQENSRIIERFLKQEESAEHVNIDADWGIETPFGRQLFPQELGHDGFFYARLTKIATQ